MRFIQVNDIHSSSTPPIWRTGTYTDDLFQKLDRVVDLAVSNRCDAIVLTGDIFHFPSPARNPHSLIIRWLKLLDSFPKWLAVIGNHDMLGRGDLSKQPLGVLDRHSNFEVMEEGRLYELGGVSVAGVHWHYGSTAETIIDLLPDDKPDALITHAAIAEVANPFFDTIGWAELVGSARVICHGHLHNGEAPGQIDGTWFSNPGALSRRCLGKVQHEDLDRKPQVALIGVDSKQVVIQYLEVPHRSAEEVYKLEQFDITQNNSEVAQFIESLKGSSVSGVSVDDLVALVNSSTWDLEVQQAAEEFLRL